MPLFSIVMPVFDREQLVPRAIESCLRQSFEDFEVVVVDDGSRDRSVEVVRGFRDPRVQLRVHPANRGVSPARNTGVDASHGDWIVFLDSDDELLPGALAAMERRVRSVRPEIDRLAFNVRFDDGGVSPEPPLAEGEWDFAGYVRWTARAGPRTDFNNCIRRRTFESLRFADNRELEGLYHLEFARRFRTATCPELVALIHCDDAARLSNRNTAQLLRQAADGAAASRRLLETFGPALREASPERYARQLREAATLHFLAGSRLEGLRLAREAMRVRPAPAMLALMGLGFTHRALLAAGLELRARAGRWRRVRRAAAASR